MIINHNGKDKTVLTDMASFAATDEWCQAWMVVFTTLARAQGEHRLMGITRKTRLGKSIRI